MGIGRFSIDHRRGHDDRLGYRAPLWISALNQLYYGDNLTVMQGMKPASVDLIYLDPPFNSKRNYNLMYRLMTGHPVPEQAEAFCDMWSLGEEKLEMVERMPIVMREHGIEDYYIEFWKLWIKALRHTQPHLLAYLVYMVQRLMKMKRLLKPTGSIYLHCDSTASHYIKVMMDGVFGHQNYRNEIIWKRSHAHNDAKQGAKHFGRITDTILYYTMSDRFTFNVQHTPYDDEYIANSYRYQDPDGRRYSLGDITGPGGKEKGSPVFELMGVTRAWRFSREEMGRLIKQDRIVQTRPGAVPRQKRYLDEMPGVQLQSLWTDIPAISNRSKEYLGYPTQKPVPLLKRIIETSSNPWDMVFDPFAGCGTTVYAAHETDRRWIGCDVAILSVRLVQSTLTKRYGLLEGTDYEVDGIPLTVEHAQALFESDPFQFQHWIVERAGGFPMQRKTADRGIDGRIYIEEGKRLREVLLSVKGGNLKPADVRDLRGVLEREENAVMAALLTLREPTKGMLQEAADAGRYEHGGKSYPRIQILTAQQILEMKQDLRSPTKVGKSTDSGQLALI